MSSGMLGALVVFHIGIWMLYLYQLAGESPHERAERQLEELVDRRLREHLRARGEAGPEV